MLKNFQESEPSGSEGEDFWIFVYVFSNTGPLERAIFDPETFIWRTKLGKGPLHNATYQSQAS